MAPTARSIASSHLRIVSTGNSHLLRRVKGNERRPRPGPTMQSLRSCDRRKRTGGDRIAMDNERDEERMFYILKRQGITWSYSDSLRGWRADALTRVHQERPDRAPAFSPGIACDSVTRSRK
jgi:hypothetical protein